MRQTLTLTALFLHALCAALLCGVAARVYGQWTGDFALWPVVAPAAALGLALAWAAGRWGARWAGPRLCAVLATAVAVAAFGVFGDSVRLEGRWELLSLRIGLSYEAWRGFVWGQAALWFAPVAAFVPFLWGRGRAVAPRGRLTVFVGFCVGMILARLFVGRVPTVRLWDAALLGMLAAGPLLLLGVCARRWTRGAAGALLAILLVGWYFGSARTPDEPLRALNPFAPIAARDSLYTGKGTEGVVLREGRLLRVAGVDEAALAASQLIPTLLKPAPNARIAARPETGAPLLPTYEIDRLKGLYDAIWVEVPPAWVADERDYFGAAAMDATRSHLAEDGILVYDLDARALDAAALMTRSGALRRHFEHVQLWMTGPNRWQLVASRQPIAVALNELSAVLDRPAVAAVFARARLGAPITLIPCCMVSDVRRLEEALAEPIAPRVPRGSARAARRLLFDGVGARRLIAPFAAFYDAESPWVTVPDATAAELRTVIAALRQARRYALEGKYPLATKANPRDPYLLCLADRALSNARAFEKLAEHEEALRSYGTAFALTEPRPADVLAAADVARATGKPGRADPYYALAAQLAPDDLDVLTRHGAYLLETDRPAEAERQASRALRIAARDNLPALVTRLRFLLATCVARQEGRRAEGLALARRVAAEAATPEDKATYIPAYGQLLIDSGRAVEGVRVKQYYQVYQELMPEEPQP